MKIRTAIASVAIATLGLGGLTGAAAWADGPSTTPSSAPITKPIQERLRDGSCGNCEQRDATGQLRQGLQHRYHGADKPKAGSSDKAAAPKRERKQDRSCTECTQQGTKASTQARKQAKKQHHAKAESGHHRNNAKQKACK